MNLESYKSNIYPFAVWFNTIFISPLLFWLYVFIIQDDLFHSFNDFVLMVFISILVGLLMSIPTASVVVLTYYLLIRFKKQIEIIKLINLALGVVGIFITSAQLNGSVFTLELIIVYSIVWIFFSVLLSPIKRQTNLPD